MSSHRTVWLSLLISAAIPGSSLLAAAWFGKVDSDFQKEENWRAPNASDTGEINAPQAGLLNKSNLAIVNGASSPLHYTEKESETTFVDQLLIGGKGVAASEMDMSGGRLVMKMRYAAIVGQVGEGKLTITKGTLQLEGGSKDPESKNPEVVWGLFVGNAEPGNGSVNISGGEVLVEGGLMLGRSLGSGVVTITEGGRLSVGGPTLFSEGGGDQKIVVGAGTGVFEQTVDGNMVFAGPGWVSFSKDSGGKLSLKGKDQKYFENLVAEGKIRIEDAMAQPASFAFKQDGEQGVYQLAP